MARRPPTTEIHVVLRTILSAGVLAVLVLACAGATWVVGDEAKRLNTYNKINYR